MLIKDQSVVVRIYREKSSTTKDGYAYRVSWIGGEGLTRVLRGKLEDAKEFARQKARVLARGLTETSRLDAFELAEARKLAGTKTLLSAMTQWAKAYEHAGEAMIEACQAWKKVSAGPTRITVNQVVEDFIKAKSAANKEGELTYRAKLKPVKTAFGDAYLDTITTRMWTDYLLRADDPVTRNDLRKRAVTLCRWAQNQGYLPLDKKTEVERTERAKEIARPIGILTPKQFSDVLEFLRRKHPELLAAGVIAGFCGLRAAEIHGKRGDDRVKRQMWDDIHLDRGFLSVTAAKENTPANRIVHLEPNTVEWLRLVEKKTGPVCDSGAMETLRRVCLEAKFSLPDNCFRHSYISYRIARTGDKAGTATEAGNSVKEIDRRYRVPLPKSDGEAWAAITPSVSRPRPGKKCGRSESPSSSPRPDGPRLDASTP